MTFQALTIVLALASLYGALLNARADIRGFYIWIAANVGWVAIDIWQGIWAQAALFLVYSVIAIYGIVNWSSRR